MLDKICFPISEEIQQLEQKFKTIIRSEVQLVNDVFNYVITGKGKRLRPILLFLSSGLTGKPTKKSIDIALVVELLHTATLIHDDVVDNSDMRRGNPSVNSIWENKISVLIGDFLFAHIFNRLLDMQDERMIRIIADISIKMSQGELLQMEKSRELLLDESIYMRLISNKTASLLAATCQLGAMTSQIPTYEHQENMRLFGEYLGIAFQIKDDLLDYYGTEESLGKPIGKDLIENIITLPVIHSLNKADDTERKGILALLENGKDKHVPEIKNFVKKNGGIEYAEQKAEFFIQKALQKLDSYSQSAYKDSLLLLANYITSRDK
ncbi:MAG: polyprenyl synthetase family protein [Calditrichaeota bacterium]|nr:polyprenyl synthetase family protein [Calditrichota bacterium]